LLSDVGLKILHAESEHC